jgi:hypothetical protein
MTKLPTPWPVIALSRYKDKETPFVLKLAQYIGSWSSRSPTDSVRQSSLRLRLVTIMILGPSSLVARWQTTMCCLILFHKSNQGAVYSRDGTAITDSVTARPP